MEYFLEASKAFVKEYGLVGIALFSFSEGFLNPIPISPVFAAAVLLFDMPLLSTFFVVTVTNILGGLFGFFLGKKLGHPAAAKLFGEKKMKSVEHFFRKWGVVGVFLASFTPIPFKAAAWASGIFQMPLISFLIASTIGRLLHFGLTAFALYFGIEALQAFL